jgi:hypothetical protein
MSSSNPGNEPKPVATCASSACLGPIMTWREVYRCTECDGTFHRDCLGPRHSNEWRWLHPRANTLGRKHPGQSTVCYCQCDDGDPRHCHGWHGQQDEPPCECLCHHELPADETSAANIAVAGPPSMLPYCERCGHAHWPLDGALTIVGEDKVERFALSHWWALWQKDAAILRIATAEEVAHVQTRYADKTNESP